MCGPRFRRAPRGPPTGRDRGGRAPAGGGSVTPDPPDGGRSGNGGTPGVLPLPTLFREAHHRSRGMRSAARRSDVPAKAREWLPHSPMLLHHSLSNGQTRNPVVPCRDPARQAPEPRLAPILRCPRRVQGQAHLLHEPIPARALRATRLPVRSLGPPHRKRPSGRRSARTGSFALPVRAGGGKSGPILPGRAGATGVECGPAGGAAESRIGGPTGLSSAAGARPSGRPGALR